MSLILDGTNGVSDIDGSASTPAIRGTDANTGIFFGTDVIGFSEGGVQSGEFNASGNLKLTGNLSVGGATPATSGSGITFPATASASSDANTLDDYEEGTWTPAIRGSGTAGTYELSIASGVYTKIGNLVTIGCNVTFAGSITGGGSGYMQVTGIPFNNATGGARGTVSASGFDMTAGKTWLTAGPIGSSGTTTWYFNESGDNANESDFPISGVSASDNFVFTATFRV